VKFGGSPASPEQIDRAQELTGDRQSREDVPALWNVGRTTLYRALGS
jgi:hypothetical protein